MSGTAQENDDESGSADKMVIPQLSEKALLATGIRIGTTVRTKTMEQFTSRPRPDGLHILDYSKTLQRIDVAGNLIAFVGPTNTVVYTSKDYGELPVQKFCEDTGAMKVTGRFMPGTFTNPLYPGHLDAELVVVADPSADSQAVTEASTLGIPVISICDTDNVTDDVDLVIPANNKGRKSLAAIFWLLAVSVLSHTSQLAEGQQMKHTIDDYESKMVEEEESDEDDE